MEAIIILLSILPNSLIERFKICFQVDIVSILSQ